MTDKEETEEKVKEDEDRELEMLLQKIYEERGMDFRDYKKASIKRRVQKRLEANNLTTYIQYMDFLDRHPEEYSLLFDTLLINVTEFFRDPEAFEILEKNVIPKMISRKRKGDTIRIWSAGCASGEEPYSIGILLAEALGESINAYEIRIYATDIDESALIEARRGDFSESKLKNVKKEFIDKYFTRENGNYRIGRTIRQMVVFGRQNLTTDAPISHLDLIVCRNVLIYFNLELQNKLLMRFHYALNRDGYIFFGKSESMLVGSKLFKPLEKKWRLFQKSPEVVAGLTLKEGRHAAVEENLIDQAIREARRELKIMDFYNQSIIQNISLGIIVLDSRNLITTWNSISEETWLIKAENAMGRDFFELGMGQRLPGIKENLDEVVREKRRIEIKELGVIDYRGEKMFLDIALVPLIDPNEDMHGVIVISRDVTDDKILKDDLKKSNEELQSLNAKLETTNEELETTNEELVSANEELETTTEELQSTAEELETSNEELQSTNEELETTNEELKSANEELEAANDELRDMTEEINAVNVYNKKIIHSMSQSLIVWNKDNIITTWNPAAEDMWGIKEGDATGKNIFGLNIGIEGEEIQQKIRKAVEIGSIYHESSLEYTAQSGEKRLMQLTIIPLNDNIGNHVGAMMLSGDVTDEKKSEALQDALLCAEGIVETVREPILVLDEHLRVKTANQAFYNTFRLSPDETVSKFIYDLEDRQWNIPGLRDMLGEIIPGNTSIQDFEVDYEFTSAGRKTLLFNASRIYRDGIGTQMILLAIKDITEQKTQENKKNTKRNSKK